MNEESVDTISNLLATVARYTRQDDPGHQGLWLEKAVVTAAPEIRRWGLQQCWRWPDWTARTKETLGASAADPGIDCVGQRIDGRWVAIQCKARQESDESRPRDIGRNESLKFASATINKDLWAERWIITNGFARFSSQFTDVYQTALSAEHPIKLVSLRGDLIRERFLRVDEEISKAHREQHIQSRDEMQSEAINAIIAGLEAGRFRSFEHNIPPPPPNFGHTHS